MRGAKDEADTPAGGSAGRPGLPQEMKDGILSGLRGIAAEKDTKKNPDMSILIGTTRKEHLQDSYFPGRKNSVFELMRRPA